MDTGLALLLSALTASVSGTVTYLIKDVVKNKIAGRYLEMSDEVSLGDEIQINGERGKVVDFANRNVYLLVEDEESYIYEEEIFTVLENSVKNYSLAGDYEND